MGLFGSSGIRGRAGVGMLRLASQVGLVLGALYPKVVVSRDTRTSSEAIKYALISGLLASGSSAYDAGLVPTPTLAYAARHCAGGAMITASHNPPEDNGIKLWNPDGSAFAEAQREQIEAALSGETLETAPWEKMEALRFFPGAVEEHLDRILADFPGRTGLRVAVDCGGGATCFATPLLLQRMGCQVTALHSYPTGFFPRGSEPVEENLGDLKTLVASGRVDLGLAHDGDGDRLVVVDEKGRAVPGDKLLALFALELKPRKLVTTVDASMAVEELGFSVTRTRVGDAFVSEELRKEGDFGGEPSGSWIFPRLSYCPDGLYAAAQVVSMACQGNLSRRVEAIPSYPIRRGSVPGAREPMVHLERYLQDLSPLSMSRVDGFRLTFADGWLLVRPSGTEPKIRVTAEARSPERADQLFELGRKAILSCQREVVVG